MRLNKFIVEQNICSRRKADELITASKVEVNDIPAELGQILEKGDKVKVKLPDNTTKEYTYNEGTKTSFYLILNKPKGYLTSFGEDENGLEKLLKEENYLGTDFATISQLQLHYAGRLDKNSTGLVLLTNDGDLSYKLTHPKFESQKEYLVELDKDIKSSDLKQFQEGVEIQPSENAKPVMTSPCFAQAIKAKEARIILKQGYKRQIRLMFKALGYQVRELKRIRIANIALKDYEIFSDGKTPYTNMVILDDLAPGKFCSITKPETI